ncbi:sulfatase-like hydrolase/transferase [Natrinema hispanicum]|uniref:Arylsulfatase A n=1 Tax=Natrinema hispanicum TaxID=392421 RepID=A0A1I0A4H4_9EURY|nr:sulfatase-like hydrolase/transferase [Natrinema hispanicum]SDC00954.1 Arylsulfatase A [Natrinema hispanicum]SES89019.1 Arylsulfatase A [Natrinema hispanicum]
MADADANSRPNILLVLTDQERYDVSAPGDPQVETPGSDWLSDRGVRFEQAFTPISICSSARASLLTGRFPHRHGMLNNCHEPDALQPNLPTDLPTFSEELANNGYNLSYIGKWHVGRDQTPEDFGFSYLGGSDKHHDDLDAAFREYRKERGVPLGEPYLEDQIYTGEDPRDASEGTLVAATAPIDVEDTRAWFIAQRTIERIKEYANGSRYTPFFHRTDFYGPHHPYVVPDAKPDPDTVPRPDPKPYSSMYKPEKINRPPSYDETYEGKPNVQKNYLAYRGVADFDWETWAEVIAKYREFVTLINDQLWRILEALEEHGLDNETVVVHAADHGDFVGHHRQFNKGPIMYDDTYRIPLQISGPDFKKKSSCESPVYLHDLAATFLEICGVDIPDTFDSQSLVPFLDPEREDPTEIDITNGRYGKSGYWPRSIFGQYHGDEFGLYSQRMVRTDQYKYVYNGPDIDELYDLEADPAELQNLIDDPEYDAERRKMRQRLIKWMDRTEDPNRMWVTGALEDAS